MVAEIARIAKREVHPPPTAVRAVQMNRRYCMKKKIGIVTIISNNYGNRLQNYALQKVINGLNYDVYTLPKCRLTWKIKIKNCIKVIIYPYYKRKNWAWVYFNDKYIRWS